MNNKKNIIKVLLISLLTLVADQITKIIVSNNFLLGRMYEIIPKFFSFCYVENDGAAFSMFGGQQLFLIIVTIFATGLIGSLIIKDKYKYKLSFISLGILLGGIFGNFIDRIFLGYVRDFISFNIFGYHFPVFNIADIGVTVGIFIYLLLAFREEKLEKNN